MSAVQIVTLVSRIRSSTTTYPGVGVSGGDAEERDAGGDGGGDAGGVGLVDEDGRVVVAKDVDGDLHGVAGARRRGAVTGYDRHLAGRAWSVNTGPQHSPTVSPPLQFVTSLTVLNTLPLSAHPFSLSPILRSSTLPHCPPTPSVCHPSYANRIASFSGCLLHTPPSTSVCLSVCLSVSLSYCSL